jgi:hypothetical protein
VEFDTFSCYTTPDEALAKKFYELTKEFCERSTIYKAQELEKFGKREKAQWPKIRKSLGFVCWSLGRASDP